jgi:hypothetical protein
VLEAVPGNLETQVEGQLQKDEACVRHWQEQALSPLSVPLQRRGMGEAVLQLESALIEKQQSTQNNFGQHEEREK